MVMNEQILECPVCQGKSALIHIGTRDDSSIDVYRCSDCGTKFLNAVNSDNDYENGYMYQKNRLSDLDIEKRLQMFQKDDIRRFEMVGKLCAGKSVLDFGCGFGGFLKQVAKVTDTCCGVELGREEREYLGSKGIRCYRTIEELHEKADIMTLFHTFEHLAEPRIWLDKFSEFIVPGGYLIIEVPHADDILLSLYESEKFADFTYWSAHIFLYTMKSLSMLIEENGKFDIVSAGQVQRYTIANHLLWLAKGQPGGHEKWDFLDGKELNETYAEKLRQLQMCDTLFYVLRRK